ncbi:MAG: hypothetical protein KKA65_04715 [Nanoarchaeota archaeon]|nr:hypothetical protein [Nanoarchaeota archaeon]MBU4242477.1 hypothetical protein [Nanoarchaeota archaeon]MBU4351985.1 hypothetical protein [Nanoarchaeota archaeon]MBU4456778.1 hypothetical protein [Nanoarchaeota archaeon]MCG2720245.1 hypothetical protein [Nanoarchaeota archaeon]
MNLQEMIKEVKSFGSSLKIVEFDNDLAVAYERQNVREWQGERLDDAKFVGEWINKSETFVGYSMLPFSGAKNREGNMQIVNGERRERFSDDAISIIESYLQNRDNKMNQLRRKVRNMYDEAISKLQIKDIRFRNWEVIKTGSLLCFGQPIMVPYVLIQNMKERYNGGTMGIVLAPVYFPLLLLGLIKYLIHPSEEGFKIKNRQIISKQQDNDLNAGLIFNGGTGKPRKFKSMKIIFKNGLELNQTGISKNYPEEFESAGFYIKLDESIERKVNTLHEKETELHEQKDEFTRLLAESDQSGILKRIGF